MEKNYLVKRDSEDGFKTRVAEFYDKDEAEIIAEQMELAGFDYFVIVE